MNFPFASFGLRSSFRKRIDHVSQEEKLFREIIAVCYQIHTKNINTLCGQDVQFVNVKLEVRIMTTGLHTVNMPHCCLKEQRNVTR
jgi:hypothetical protein